MSGSKRVKPIHDMIAEKRSAIEKLELEIVKRKGEIETLELALRRMTGQPDQPVKARQRRSNVKGYLLDLLTAAGETGLNAVMAVDVAAKAGEHLERGTISSLLSRFKNEGVVSYNGTVYKVIQRQAKAEDASAVH